MRIVGGTARGRRLLAPPSGLDLRPTSDKVREAVFDVLAAARGGAIAGRVIDLFAGTGAFGLEALSRGASEALFVEKDPSACGLIRENLRRLGFEGAGRVVADDARRAVGRLASAGEAPFDLAFLDPPYGRAGGGEVAERLASEGLLAAEGVVVIESSAREEIEAPPSLEIFRRKRYGDTCVAFLRMAEPPAAAGGASGKAGEHSAGAAPGASPGESQ